MQTVSCGITKIQRSNTKDLKELKDTLLVEDPWGKPIVAVIPYDYYLKMQETILWANAKEIDKEMSNV